MIKKLFFCSALVACLTLSSCSKSPEQYAKEAAELSSQALTAIQNGDAKEIAALQEKAQKLDKEIQDRCQNDPEFAEEFGKAMLQYQAELSKQVIDALPAMEDIEDLELDSNQ